MFDSLDEQIERTQDRGPTEAERVVRYLLVIIASVALFSAVVFAVWLLE